MFALIVSIGVLVFVAGRVGCAACLGFGDGFGIVSATSASQDGQFPNWPACVASNENWPLHFGHDVVISIGQLCLGLMLKNFSVASVVTRL